MKIRDRRLEIQGWYQTMAKSWSVTNGLICEFKLSNSGIAVKQEKNNTLRKVILDLI